MKLTFINPIIFIVFITLSYSCRNYSTDLPVIDASKSYPEKEIFLDDIANVSYVSMRSDDNYLYSGYLNSVSKNTIVIVDNRAGDIFLFSRNGEPKSRFNNTGRGPGEYLFVAKVLYDENTDEIFLTDYYNPRSIKVYSSLGMFKRELFLPEGIILTNHIELFDDHSLFFFDEQIGVKESIRINQGDLSEDDYLEPYYLISKDDGEVLDYFELPVRPSLGFVNNNSGFWVPALSRPLVKSTEGVFICNPQNDTVFLYDKNRRLTPVLSKKPKAKSMNPMVYLDNCIELGQYQFIDLGIIRPEDTPAFTRESYMRDKKSGEIFRQKLRLQEYEDKEFFISTFRFLRHLYSNGCWFELELLELKEAYLNNKLSGKLKELVATLDEDDNNVFVFVDF